MCEHFVSIVFYYTAVGRYYVSISLALVKIEQLNPCIKLEITRKFHYFITGMQLI